MSCNTTLEHLGGRHQTTERDAEHEPPHNTNKQNSGEERGLNNRVGVMKSGMLNSGNKIDNMEDTGKQQRGVKKVHSGAQAAVLTIPIVIGMDLRVQVHHGLMTMPVIMTTVHGAMKTLARTVGPTRVD